MTHEKIIDGATVTSGGGTAEGTMDVSRADRNVRIFVDGDGNSSNLDIEFYVQFEDGSSWFYIDGTPKKGVDLSTAEYTDNAAVFNPDFRPSETLKVKLTNNAASNTTVTVHGKAHYAV